MSIRRFFARLLIDEERIMSALTDLQAVVAGLTASVDAAVTVIQSKTDDSAQLAALTTQLNAIKAKLDQAVSAVNTSPSA